MRILCLVDWRVRANSQWFWDYVPDSPVTVDYVKILPPKDRFPGYGKLLGYYQKYWLLALKALRRMDEYDAIVAWEGKNGIPLGLLRSLLNKQSPPFIILNFVLKGRVVLDNVWFIRRALRSVNHITCVSHKEVDYYSAKLSLPRTRFSQVPSPWPDHHKDAVDEIEAGDYILAAGRSHRDYETLVKAVRGLPIKTVINGRPFNFKGLDPPPNVTFNGFLPRSEFFRLVRGARFIVLPLHEAKHASGETFLLEAMSAYKPIIATETFSTTEYVREGVNGFLVPAGDVKAMRERVAHLWERKDMAVQMGLRARIDYEENWSTALVAQRIDRLVRDIISEDRGYSSSKL